MTLFFTQLSANQPEIDFSKVILSVSLFPQTYSWHRNGVRLAEKELDIRLRNPNVRDILEAQALTVTLRMPIADCRSTNISEGLNYCLKKVELFKIDEDIDDCFMPDTPLGITVERRRTPDGVTSNYICNSGFKVKANVVAPSCPKNGDWSAFTAEPCEPIVL